MCGRGGSCVSGVYRSTVLVVKRMFVVLCMMVKPTAFRNTAKGSCCSVIRKSSSCLSFGLG